MKMLLVPAEGCDRATEEMWCCLSVRVSDLRRLVAMGMEIPLVSYDFFSEFYSAQIFVFPRDRGGRSLLLIAIFNALSAYHFYRLSRNTQQRAFRVTRFRQSAPTKSFPPLAPTTSRGVPSR